MRPYNFAKVRLDGQGSLFALLFAFGLREDASTRGRHFHADPVQDIGDGEYLKTTDMDVAGYLAPALNVSSGQFEVGELLDALSGRVSEIAERCANR